MAWILTNIHNCSECENMKYVRKSESWEAVCKINLAALASLPNLQIKTVEKHLPTIPHWCPAQRDSPFEPKISPVNEDNIYELDIKEDK
jgi:hypothetical protein